jgi:LDH2 family malate/lactate/ureidoglycolate dehydrogenase
VARGLFVLLTSNGAPNTPVWGGVSPRMTGPLPLTVGVPVAGRPPFVLDIAMGMQSRGKILYAAEKGLPVAPGTGLDADGQPTTDPRRILEGGRILPIGGYKGFGITMVLEILCGVLTGGAVGVGLRELYNTPTLAQKIGHFALVIDPAAFTSRDAFLTGMAAYLEMIKSSERVPGVDEIIVAGEPEERRYAAAIAHGVPLEGKVLAALETLAADLGVTTGLAGFVS